MKFNISEGAPVKISTVNSGSVNIYRITGCFGDLPPIKFSISWKIPAIDVYSVWSPSVRESHSLQPNWSMRTTRSRLASWMPLHQIISADGRNRLCISLSDVAHPISISTGICEFDSCIDCRIEFFTDLTAPMGDYEVLLRLDMRDIEYEKSLNEVTQWWENDCGYKSAFIPPAAREPVNSLWYSMHHDLNADKIVKQCEMSFEYGMKTVIIDDGWQMDKVNSVSGVYAQCGDWKPSFKKMGEMRKLSERIHNTGMKVVLWYSVPFVGVESTLYGKFSDMLLDESGDRKTYFCLDPRYKAVRDHLADTYETAVREWDLDGLKLDFIDAFCLRGKSIEKDCRRDCLSLEEAVEKLMSEIRERLIALKPDILIEFRQTYIGPAIRQYGNMLRASDCPLDAIKNRVDTANLRLTSGKTPVHSDMMMWNTSDSAENAAVQLAASLFAVPQVSVLLDELSESHRKTLKFYLGFWRRYREVLLDGEFRASNPESMYSSLTSILNGIAVTVRFTDPVLRITESTLIAVNAGFLKCFLICGGSGMNFRVVDCMGQTMTQGTVCGAAAEIAVPRGGMLKVTELISPDESF